MHIGNASSSGPERLFAMRLAAGKLLDFATIAATVKHRFDTVIPVELTRCLRCGGAVENPWHWILDCPGRQGSAVSIRDRQYQQIQLNLGLDLGCAEMRDWLVPLAAGHVHPNCWAACDNTAGGCLRWAETRQKMLFLLVRVVRMAKRLWCLRCREVLSAPADSYQGLVVEALRFQLFGDTRRKVTRDQQGWADGVPAAVCGEQGPGT